MHRRLIISLGVFLLQSVSMSVVRGQDVASDPISITPWTPKDYPDPDLDARTCRTVHNRLCDPDSILTDADIRLIENYLQRDRPFNPSECAHTIPDNEGSIQVQLAVALVKKVSFFFQQCATMEEIDTLFTSHSLLELNTRWTCRPARTQ